MCSIDTMYKIQNENHPILSDTVEVLTPNNFWISWHSIQLAMNDFFYSYVELYSCNKFEFISYLLAFQ